MSESSRPSTPLTIRIPPVTIENEGDSITPIPIDNNEEFSFTEEEISLLSENAMEEGIADGIAEFGSIQERIAEAIEEAEAEANLVSSPSLLTPTATEDNISENLTETFEEEAADPVEDAETDIEEGETDIEEGEIEENETDEEDTDILQYTREEEKEEEEHKNEKESYDCGVCYKSLNMDNSVVTKCKHHYCNDCFYRWIQTQATCPMCRTPINCNLHLTDEQLDRETSIEFVHYMQTLERINSLTSAFMKQKNKWSKLTVKTNMLLNRQISLRNMTERTLAHNDGLIAARKSVVFNDKAGAKLMGDRYCTLYDTTLYGAFIKSYKSEKKRLKEEMELGERKIEFSFEPPKRKITIKKRTFDEVDVVATESKERSNKSIKTSD